MVTPYHTLRYTLSARSGTRGCNTGTHVLLGGARVGNSEGNMSCFFFRAKGQNTTMFKNF